jgi:hypothetical protein
MSCVKASRALVPGAGTPEALWKGSMGSPAWSLVVAGVLPRLFSSVGCFSYCFFFPSPQAFN